MADLPTDSMVIQNAIKRDGRSASKFCNRDTLLARITPCLENGKTGFVNFMGGRRSRSRLDRVHRAALKACDTGVRLLSGTHLPFPGERHQKHDWFIRSAACSRKLL